MTEPSERTPEWVADAIMVVIQRERDLTKRFGLHALVLALLKGEADIEVRPCKRIEEWDRERRCGSGGAPGKVEVTCERSGGLLYEEIRDCETCRGAGAERRLKFQYPAYD